MKTWWKDSLWVNGQWPALPMVNGQLSQWPMANGQVSQWRRSGVFIVNFEHISHLVLVFLLLTLSREMPTGKCPLTSAPQNDWT